ncbi:MAG: FtsX-like permease family protein [Saprospiraceae bacterium]
MIRHILTLIWNKKRSNITLLLEIILAYLVLFAVFTFAIHFLRIYQTPLGFDTQDILQVHLTYEEGLDSAQLADVHQALRREVAALPEVMSVSLVGQVTPFSGSTWTNHNVDNGFELSTALYFTDAAFYETAGVKLVEGRWFEEDDHHQKYPAVVISKALRDKYFKDKPVLDSVYTLASENRIVGVIEHFKYRDEFEEEMPITISQHLPGNDNLAYMLIRLQPGTPATVEASINQIIADVTKRRDFVIESLEALRKKQSRTTWVPLITGLSIAGFLLLNIALGLFGVLFYNISKRKAEIGLRRALGASSREIRWQFMGEITLVAVAGILIASVLAAQIPFLELLPIPADNFYRSMLLSSAILLAVVWLCTLAPSAQAARVHPAVALREE